jgi:hypothetical protein
LQAHSNFVIPWQLKKMREAITLRISSKILSMLTLIVQTKCRREVGSENLGLES